jgi:hypothetical protein
MILCEYFLLVILLILGTFAERLFGFFKLFSSKHFKYLGYIVVTAISSYEFYKTAASVSKRIVNIDACGGRVSEWKKCIMAVILHDLTIPIIPCFFSSILRLIKVILTRSLFTKLLFKL